MQLSCTLESGGGGGQAGGTPYNGLHGDAPPERGTFFALQVHKRVRISRVEVYERVSLSFRYLKGPFQYFEHTYLKTVLF